MARSKIQYRPIKSSDHPTLEKIIRKAWNYDRLGSPRLAKRIAKISLSKYLINQTFTSVAVSNGEPVGIIMGKNRKTHRKSLKYLLLQWVAIVRVALSKEGRNIGKLYKEIDLIDKELLKGTDTKFDGELAFFVLDENQRGTGIGKELYQQFSDYIASENLKTFFLFTDSTCNHGFYDYQGLQRLSEEKFHFPQLKETTSFYLYGNLE